ncbi:MAG: GtrA family protein, partial [Bifidobacteriaceae bacterium]|nr:GtrA family protein [Bifidobacteriaceae bacterium]
MRRLFLEATKFGTVGALAFIVDNGGYFLLVNGPGRLLAPYPVRASVLASAIAVVFSYVGNRYWTFAQHRSRPGQAQGAASASPPADAVPPAPQTTSPADAASPPTDAVAPAP